MADCIHLRCAGHDHCQFDYIFIDQTEPIYGRRVGIHLLQTHGPAECAGQVCTIHNPSNHHMRTWSQLWRNDWRRMERLCPHDKGHPDPDDLNPITEHVCDGCCTPPQETENAAPANPVLG